MSETVWNGSAARKAFLDQVREIGEQGFHKGWAGCAESLAEPQAVQLVAAFLASHSHLTSESQAVAVLTALTEGLLDAMRKETAGA